MHGACARPPSEWLQRLGGLAQKSLGAVQDPSRRARRAMAPLPHTESTGWTRLFWDALNVIAPIALANGLEYLPVCFAIALVGRSSEGDEALDALALARSFFNVVAMAPGMGMVSALRTILPQLAGAGRTDLFPVVVQRAFVFILINAVPSIALVFFSEDLLVAAGQPRHLAALARPYCLRLIPTYFFFVGVCCLQRTLQAVRLNWHNLAVTAITCAASPAILWAFIHGAQLGFLGAAWASVATNALFLGLQALAMGHKGHGAVFRPCALSQVLAPRALWDYAALAAPGYVMSVLRWGQLEALVLLGGHLRPPGPAIAALSVTTTMAALGLMVWAGCHVAAATMTGERLGAGKTAAAKRAALTVVAIAAAAGALVASLVFALRRHLARLFTASISTNRTTSVALPVVAVALGFDALAMTLAGVCGGMGLQRFSALAQVAAFYLVGLPVGLVLAFKVAGGRDRGVAGLWAGVAWSLLAAALCQGVVLLLFDWRRAEAEAQRRISREHEAAEEARLPPVEAAGSGLRAAREPLLDVAAGDRPSS